jgi:hypothetical protein
VQKTGYRRGEIAQWSHHVTGDFEALAGLTSMCPGAAVLLHARPYKTLRDQLRYYFGAQVRQIMDGLEHLEP